MFLGDVEVCLRGVDGIDRIVQDVFAHGFRIQVIRPLAIELVCEVLRVALADSNWARETSRASFLGCALSSSSRAKAASA